MGMFDTIIIEGESTFKRMTFNNLSLQTKSLECNLDTYFINSKKNLIKKNIKYRSMTIKEKNAYKKKWEDDYGEKWEKKTWRVFPWATERVWNSKFNYTGNIELYTYDDGCKYSKYPFWLMLNALFEKGTLKKIEVTNFEVYKDRLKEIRKRDADFLKSVKILIKECKGKNLDDVVELIKTRYYCKLEIARKIASLIMTNANIATISDVIYNRFV
jgi:hypothetical protein